MDRTADITFLFLFIASCALFHPSRCQGPGPPSLKRYEGTKGRGPIAKRVQFNVLIRPQRRECFYEEGFAGTYHVVYFQVMNEDAEVQFVMSGPTESEPKRELGVRGHHTNVIETDGEYSYCLFNVNRAYLKVNFMLTLVDKNRERRLYEESRDVPEEFQNAWNATLYLIGNVDSMYSHMFQQRRRYYYDKLLVQNNGQFVAVWSFAQCCVIILASVIQVYVLRTMFRTVSVTPTNKPRS